MPLSGTIGSLSSKLSEDSGNLFDNGWDEFLIVSWFLADVVGVQASIDTATAADVIARLQHELRVAQERADVAEEQLRRVHVAVRAFKEKQMQERVSSAHAQKPAAWQDGDPSLDERLDQYLLSDFEPDRSRTWMLGGKAA